MTFERHLTTDFAFSLKISVTFRALRAYSVSPKSVQIEIKSNVLKHKGEEFALIRSHRHGTNLLQVQVPELWFKAASAWLDVKLCQVCSSYEELKKNRTHQHPARRCQSISLFCPCVQVPVPIGRRVSGFAWTPTWSSAGGETQVQRRASKHSPDCAALDLITIKVTRTQARNFIFQKGCLSCLTPVTHMSN